MSEHRKPPAGAPARAATSNRGNLLHGKRVVRSEELLQGQREVLLEHEGAYYTLRRTSSGKLILTK
jgi:hemin uptake protein HemP